MCIFRMGEYVEIDENERLSGVFRCGEVGDMKGKVMLGENLVTLPGKDMELWTIVTNH